MKDTLTFFNISSPKQELNPRKFFTQLSCHFEEFLEGVEALGHNGSLNERLESAINDLRTTYPEEKYAEAFSGLDKIALADSLADQYVTLIGTARAAGIDIASCIKEVEASNLSKFVHVGFGDISDLEWIEFNRHTDKIKSEGRYKGVYWKRVGEYAVWYDGSGKILKGPNYFEPKLDKFIGE